MKTEKKSICWVQALVVAPIVLIAWTAINGVNGVFENVTDRGAMIGLCGLIAMGIMIVVALVGAVTDGE